MDPKKEHARRSSIGLANSVPGELERWKNIQKQEAKVKSGGKVDWSDITTPLTCPYKTVRKVQPQYALPLLPHLVRVPPCLAPNPVAHKDSFTRAVQTNHYTIPTPASAPAIPSDDAAVFAKMLSSEGIIQPPMGSRSQSTAGFTNELQEFIDFYGGPTVLMGVEKKLTTVWSGGGFSPRFFQDHARPRSMLTSGPIYGRNIHN